VPQRLASHSLAKAVNLDQSLMLELIAQSQVVSNEVLSQVAQLASMRNSQVIDVLFESGFVAASDRRAFLDAAQSIRSNWLFKPWAVQALKRALSDFLPFSQVLEELDLHPSNAFSDSSLGQLAMACQLIDRDQFNQARQYSLARGLTIGQSLNRCCGMPISMYKILIDGLGSSYYWTDYRRAIASASAQCSYGEYFDWCRWRCQSVAQVGSQYSWFCYLCQQSRHP
jgi:hypothetical protein